MPRGRDSRHDPNRRPPRVTRDGNVIRVDFGHPMANHPAFLAQQNKKKPKGMPEGAMDIMDLANLPDDHDIFKGPKFPDEVYDFTEQDEVEMSKKRDDAPPKGMKRPKLTKKEMED